MGSRSSHNDHSSQASCLLAFELVADPVLSPACSRQLGEISKHVFCRPDVSTGCEFSHGEQVGGNDSSRRAGVTGS